MFSTLSRQRSAAPLILAVVGLLCLSLDASAGERQFTDAEREVLKRVKTIRLVLKTTSWLQNRDWSDLNQTNGFPHYLLDEVGLRVVSGSAVDSDALLIVDYVEREKPGYGLLGVGRGYSGTDISCAVELLHPKIGRVLAFTISGATPFSVESAAALHSSALLSFQRDPGFLLFAPRIARTLGVRTIFPDVASRLVAMLRYSDEADRSSAAVALGELADPSTAVSLSALLNLSERPFVIHTVAAALTRIGNPAALPALRRLAEQTADPDTKQRVQDAIATLERR